MNNKEFNTKEWASGVWRKSANDWVERSEQDYNYRDYLVRPALEQFFKNNHKDILQNIWVDFGCGEGRETFMLSKIFESLKIKSQFVGLDFQPELIEKANKDFSKDGIKFFDKTLGAFVKDQKEKIGGFSFLFVLQDTSKAKQLLESAAQALPKGGLIVVVIVHPEFAKKLKAEQLIKIEKVGENEEWEWCGEYPIAEIDKKPFHVPYFQREVGWYVNLLEKNNMEILLQEGLQPNVELLKKADSEKLSPFYNYPDNVYWPHMSEGPSSFLLIAKKKGQAVIASPETKKIIVKREG